ncbi:TetR family transcriptional regulator [Streptomyces sp. NPDC001732]
MIDVGVNLVPTEGSASVGLREIARRAGVSHGAPRRYFPTHHALLSAVAHRGFEDLGTRSEAAATDTTAPRDQLEALARTYVGYALERRGMFELMFRHDLLTLLGAGFATVMVTTTGTVVGDAPPGYAGVLGGLKQTAMNIGPTLGIAVAVGTSRTPAPAFDSALLILAGIAVLGLPFASLLPSGRPTDHAGCDTADHST